MEAIFGLVATILVDFVFVVAGKLVIYALTLGRWRGERAGEGRIHGAAGALSFVRDGQRVLTDRSACFVGGFFCIVLVFCSFAVMSL
ncbi:hypothetical protein PMI14_01214 [Acidovorax sp. CF316]|uniref:hypothetical protein n=1 Tax=Acidovorax sp. CF316 TaxID=1144317 RepID=UPI00026BDABF|nr:hypothetical protein [Acidovorax sp. CF316]EJE53891.1 hypothetical protein PMI14_01214 [Acidovorax sp. CF316]